MPRRLASALALTGVLGLASCSLIDAAGEDLSDATSSASSSSSASSASSASSTSSASPSSTSTASSPSSTRPPQAGASDLLLPVDDISVGERWRVEQGRALEDQVADHPRTSDGGTVKPSRCTEAALVTKGPDGAGTDFAGATGKSSDDSGSPVLVVIKDGRSAADLRTAREKCSTFTAKAPDRQLTMTDAVTDGPDIQGADESFALNSTYELDGHQGNSFTRYGVVAEVRGTIVVVMVNPDDTASGDNHSTTTMSTEAKAEAVDLVTNQVDRIASAN